MIGGGARGMIAKALDAEGRPDAKAHLDRLFSAFIEHYAAHIADQRVLGLQFFEAAAQVRAGGILAAVVLRSTRGAISA